MCVCVCTGKSDDGDAHDAALPFHKLAGEPSLFSFFFRSIVCVCVYYMCPSAFSHFHPLVTLLLFLVSCRSFYYGGARASAISYRRDDAHISSVCAASRGALAPAAADASTAAAAAQLGTLDGGQPTLLDPTAVYISIFFSLSLLSAWWPCSKMSLILFFFFSLFLVRLFRCSHSVSFHTKTIKLINPDVVSLSVLNTHLPHAVVVPSCIYPIELRPAYYSFFFFFFFSPFFRIRYPQSMLLERCKPPR